MDNRKEGSDLGVAPETVAGLSGSTLRSGPADDGVTSPTIPNADLPITLRFADVRGRDGEVFALCKYSDIAERMAQAIVREVGMPVLVVHLDQTQPIRRFDMAKVEKLDVVKTHVPRDAKATTPNP